MKILMLLESEFPHDVRVENEIEALTEAGFEVHLACPTRKNRPAKEIFNGATIHRKPISNFIYKSSIGSLKLPFYFNFWWSYVSSIFQKESFDAIHIHDLPLARIGARIKEKFSIPLIIDLHENWPELLRISTHTKSFAGRLLCSIEEWKEYEKKYLKKADRIIVVVDEAAERLKRLSVPENKISVVSNTINLKGIKARIKIDKAPTDKKVLIYEGGITFHRGLQYVLEALSKIRDAAGKIELQIVGTGNYLETLKQMSVRLQVEPMVKFHGWQPQEKVYKMIGSADAALIPHIKSPHTDSTIPHKLFHYMYAGIPILASNCDPIERIIKETSAGFIYQFNITDDLASKIKMILAGILTVDQISGREWVTNKYNWKADGERLVSAYKHFLK